MDAPCGYSGLTNLIAFPFMTPADITTDFFGRTIFADDSHFGEELSSCPKFTADRDTIIVVRISKIFEFTFLLDANVSHLFQPNTPLGRATLFAERLCLSEGPPQDLAVMPPAILLFVIGYQRFIL